MVNNDEILEYYRLSQTYSRASLELLQEDLFEPALFNAIHSLELGIKSTLIGKIGDDLILHQVGGLFGREYRNIVGNQLCKEINSILSMYNLPRYPGMVEITRNEAEETVKFVQMFITEIVPGLIEQ